MSVGAATAPRCRQRCFCKVRQKVRRLKEMDGGAPLVVRAIPSMLKGTPSVGAPWRTLCKLLTDMRKRYANCSAHLRFRAGAPGPRPKIALGCPVFIMIAVLPPKRLRSRRQCVFHNRYRNAVTVLSYVVLRRSAGSTFSPCRHRVGRSAKSLRCQSATCLQLPTESPRIINKSNGRMRD